MAPLVEKPETFLGKLPRTDVNMSLVLDEADLWCHAEVLAARPLENAILELYEGDRQVGGVLSKFSFSPFPHLALSLGCWACCPGLWRSFSATEAS